MMTRHGPLVGEAEGTLLLDDASLLRSVGHGDNSALHTLYDLYGPRCFGLALRLLSHDQGAAEDVVQDVFVRVWQCAHMFDGERGSARAWIMASTSNACVDRVRHRARRLTPISGAVIADVPDPTDVWRDVAQRLAAEEVRAALNSLPREQKVAIELAYFEGFTCTQIAGYTGAPLGTVKERIRLGLRKLRVVLVASTGSPGAVRS
jgi:RNA polymerase sigma-70 factor (ECF subfamily)